MAGVIDVVIVNWNSGALLRECLLSIERTGHDVELISRVIVVDNGSHDGSATGLPTISGKLELIVNAQNQGFAVGCNQGARLGQCRNLLFLNPDTQMRPGVLPRVLHVFEDTETRRAGVVGVQLVGLDGKIARSCARFPTPSRMLAEGTGISRILPNLFPPHFMVEWNHESERYVDQVMGAFFFVRRSDFEQLKGFDEQFFVYCEEVDFCRRLAMRGKPALFIADVSVVHHGRGTTRKVFKVALFYALRSRTLYVAKHFGTAKAAAYLAGTLTLEPVARLAVAAWRRNTADAHATLFAYSALARWVLTRMPSKEIG